MYCEKCGKEIVEGALFCDGCGERIENGGGPKKQGPAFYDSVAFKQRAKNAISNNKWLYFTAFIIVTTCIIGAISFTGIGIFLSFAFVLSYYWVSVDLLNGQGVSFEHILTPFKQFEKTIRAIGVTILSGLVVSLASILLFIPGIILGLAYSQAIYLVAKEDGIGVIEAMTKSREMMKGHKWEHFCFIFSFIGHFILTVITFGLWSFYLNPYMNVARVVYFQYVYDDFHKEDSVSYNSYYDSTIDKDQA